MKKSFEQNFIKNVKIPKKIELVNICDILVHFIRNVAHENIRYLLERFYRMLFFGIILSRLV